MQASSDVEQKKTGTTMNGQGTQVQRLPTKARDRRPFYWLLAFFCLTGALALNLYRLGVPSIWFDEAFSVELARQPFPLLWSIIFGPEPNMELYYLFLHGWLALTSLSGLHPTEFVVRLPSAIFAALGTVSVLALGRRFIGTLAGGTAAALYALNYLQLVYAQQARSYSLQLLLICISWYALLMAIVHSSRARRWWICYVVAIVLAVYTHLFSMLILLAQLIMVAGVLLLPNQRREQTRERLLGFALSVLATAILIIPMQIVARQGAKTGWLPAPGVRDLVHFFVTASGSNRFYLAVLALCCLLAVGLAALKYARQHAFFMMRVVTKQDTPDTLDSTQAGERMRIFIVYALLCWLLVPLLVSFAVSQGSMRLFSDRYLVTIVPPLFLLVGLGVSVLKWRILQGILVLCLVVLALPAVPLYYNSAQVEDWNVTTHWLQARYQQGDGLVCYDNSTQQGCQVSVEYYLHAYPSGAHFSADTPGGFSWTRFGPADPTAGPDAAVDHKTLAAYGAKHQRLFFIIGRVRDEDAAARALVARQWLDNHYHRIGQIETRTVTIYLYDTRARR
jgi:mannosyltransferase